MGTPETLWNLRRRMALIESRFQRYRTEGRETVATVRDTFLLFKDQMQTFKEQVLARQVIYDDRFDRDEQYVLALETSLNALADRVTALETPPTP